VAPSWPPCRPSVPWARNSTPMLSTRPQMSPASTVGIKTLPTSANRMAILAIPTPTTDPQATTTGTAETEIKTTHSNSSNESCPDSSGISAPSFAQQGRRNFGGQTQPHSEAICHACGEMGHVHLTRIVTRTFSETAGSSTELLWPSRTLARTPLLLTSLPTWTMPRPAVNAPRDPPPLLRIAGVTDPMTSAGRVSNSSTLWMNLASLSLSLASPRPLRLPVSQMSFSQTLAQALTGLSATHASFETFAQPSDPQPCTPTLSPAL